MNYCLMTQSSHRTLTDDFMRTLTSRWPTASLKNISDPRDNHAVEFQIPTNGATIDGALNREGSGVIYHGEIRDCAQFALWYQTAFHEGQPYLMFDEGYNRHIALRPDTTVEDIVRALTDPPYD